MEVTRAAIMEVSPSTGVQEEVMEVQVHPGEAAWGEVRDQALEEWEEVLVLAMEETLLEEEQVMEDSEVCFKIFSTLFLS